MVKHGGYGTFIEKNMYPVVVHHRCLINLNVI